MIGAAKSGRFRPTRVVHSTVAGVVNSISSPCASNHRKPALGSFGKVLVAIFVLSTNNDADFVPRELRGPSFFGHLTTTIMTLTTMA
eukprot:15465234-Alexandrium_andersonii.AAC.1